MTVLSEAMYTARELAMTRMEEEADQLGADGIVGVRLDVGRYEWGAGHGGVHRHRHRDQAPRRRAAPRAQRPPVHQRPLGPGLLDAAAHRPPPVGMVMGSCVYHVAHRGMLQSFRQMGQNVELPNFTQALYDARELAMERMQAEAEAVKAEGIVGVQLTERNHGWGSHVIEFFALGTAIVPVRRGAPDRRADAGARLERQPPSRAC